MYGVKGVMENHIETPVWVEDLRGFGLRVYEQRSRFLVESSQSVSNMQKRPPDNANTTARELLNQVLFWEPCI